MFPPSAATLVGLLSLFSTGASALPQTSSGSSSSSTACNNSPDLCDRAYNNVTYIGAHDSPFLRDDSTNDSTAGNQFLNATKALSAGLRLLQGQVHVENETDLYLCHTSCSLLNAGLLSDWLGDVRYWMDQNPNEVVTLVLVNSDDATAAQLAAEFESAGIDQYGYAPSSSEATSTWPSLQDMIDDGTRLVTFVASITADSTYPYLLPEFTYVFETEYEVLSLSGFNCSVDRPSSLVDDGGAASVNSGYLSMVNHFAYKTLIGDIIIPNVDDIDTTNSNSTTTTGALGTHVERCDSEWGASPNFVLVDFWNKGDVMAVGDSMNDITNAIGRTEFSSDDEGDSDSDGSSSAAGKFDVGTGMALVAFLAAALFMF